MMDNQIQSFLFSLFLLLAWTGAQGQAENIPQRLNVSEQMTTNLIFPSPILSVDQGSLELLAQKANGVQNILQVKAAKRELEKTNLTVITQDGKLYTFLVSYAEFADPINLMVKDLLGPPTVRAIVNGKNVPPHKVRKGMDWACRTDLVPFLIRKHSYGISFSLDGVFIQDGRMYFRFRFYNNSNVPFQPDQLRFFIKDNKTTKRTPSQDLEVTPEFVVGEHGKLIEYVMHTLVFSLPSFTLPKGKHLRVELMELSGGRNLVLKVRNRHILKTLPVPNL